MIQAIISFCEQHWLGLVIGSLATAVAGLAISFFVLLRMPHDTLTKPRRREALTTQQYIWRVLRTVIGVVVVAIGIAFLFLPGQGVFLIVVGILLTAFPGKRQLVAWLLNKTRAIRSINSLRTKYGRPPLEMPQATGGA